MNLAVDRPWVLLALAFALLPLVFSGHRAAQVGSVAVIPADAVSMLIGWVLRCSAMAAIALVVIALAGPYRLGQTISRAGEGGSGRHPARPQRKHERYVCRPYARRQ